MALISQQTIDEILNAADIVDIVGEYVKLQPAGKNFKGLCPFHSEKTPSFFVSPDKHIFNCFGCGEKGNSLAFLQKYKNLSFTEALKSLADRYHIPLDVETNQGPDEKTKRLYEITEAATGFYSLSLTNMASGKPALEYLQKRGLDIHTIQYFELGFASPDFDTLYQTLKTKYQELDLLELGLIKKSSEGSYYDLFRNRIIFPIRNEYGKVVGYSGRLYENKKDEPKYVNSPFTTIFTKGDILYNLDRAQAAIKTQKRVILYEGFMDVIASVKAGLKEAVCSMGTALTTTQAILLRKYADKVLLCYDGDSAGFEAMEKAIPILENAGLAVSLLILPEELDPDDYVQKYSAAQYAQYVENNQIDKYEFQYQYMKKHTDFRKAAEIERFKIALFMTLQKEASATLAEIYLRHLAADANVDFETIRADFNQYGLSQKVSQSLTEKRTRLSAGLMMNKFMRAEQLIVCYYTRAAEYRRVVRDRFPGNVRFCADDRNDEIILNIDDLLADNPDADVLTLVPRKFFKNQDEIRVVMTLKKDEYCVQELEECLNTLAERDSENNVKALERQLSQLDPAADKEEKIRIMDLILKEKKRGNEINGKKRNSKKVS